MSTSSVPLLLVAAAGVGIAHSILPDHWVPLAVIARTNRWSLGRTAKVSFLASLGHVAVSLVLGIVLAAAGLALRNAVVAEEGQIVGGVLVLTGIGFLVWALRTRGHGHGHSHGHGHTHAHPHPHTHEQTHDPAEAPTPAHTHGHGSAHVHDHGEGHHNDAGQPHDHDDGEGHHHHHDDHDHDHPHGAATTVSGGRRGSWLAEIAVPFGVAASPDLTILPVFLAASAVGVGAAIGTLVTFTLATLATFVVLTVVATIGGYQVEWPWLENNGHVVSALVLLVIGVLVFLRV